MTVGAGAPPGSNTSLLIDMNLSPRWIPLLVAAGFAAEHWSNLGPADAADPDLMAIARERGMVVLTHDLDFGAILAAGALVSIDTDRTRVRLLPLQPR